MLTNKNDRHIMHRIPKDATVTSSLHKKGNVPNSIPRLKSDRPNKSKQESFPTPVLRLTNKKHQNCFPPPETPRTRKKTPTALKMKSVSLVDLPNEDKSQPKIWTQRKTVSREHDEDDPKCTNQIESRISNILNPNHMFSFTSIREIELAKKVCRKLILHAWRKSRSQTTNLQLVNNSLKKEVANFRIQTCVLKDLLESEKNRVKLSTNELNLIRNKLEEERKTSKTLNEHLSRREVAFSEEKVLWRSLEIQMDERNVSLKNELEIAVENGLQQKEKALSLNKMLDDSRKNEVTLKYKIEMLETSLKDKMNDMNTSRNKSLDLQTKVEDLVKRNHELARENQIKEKQISGYINNLKNVEVELNNFRNFQKVHSSEFAKLRYDCEEVKTQINNKDLEIRCLRETIRLNETDEKQLKNKFKTVALQVFQLSLNIIPLPNYIPI